jgi:hypothetical protein
LGLNEENSSVKETLERLVNLVDEMNERQRLTRLDTVMFLVYPMIILGITLLANGFAQYETLGEVEVRGLPFSFVLFYGSVLFAGGIFLGFLGLRSCAYSLVRATEFEP